MTTTADPKPDAMELVSLPGLDITDVWEDDPIRPMLDDPTPEAIIHRLTPHDRALRVRHLTARAFQIVDEATDTHLEGKQLTARCLLFSGGNDSTILAHMFRRQVDCAVHINTGIGIEQTREFVRETCTNWGLALMERHTPESYRDLVVERGFPGPAMHFKMFQRLKERGLEAVRSELVPNPRRQRVLYIAGRRRAESRRREAIAVHERRKSIIWASPLVAWTKWDMNTYRQLHEVPINPVSAAIHMSGECLCGAFAKPGELDEIGFWFPDTRHEIEALEAEVRAAGHQEPWCRWGHGKGKPSSRTGYLCSSCTPLVEAT